MTESTYDLIIWGATGYTGKLVAEYLAARAPANSTRVPLCLLTISPSIVEWAIAGRNEDKLKRIRDELDGKVGTTWTVVMCDPV